MSDIDKADPHGCDDGALTDRFGVLIQGLLAIVAFSTLMCEWRQQKKKTTPMLDIGFPLGPRAKSG